MNGEPPPRPAHGTAILLVVAAAALVTFHYFVRTDALGVLAHGRDWHPLTGAPTTTALHYLASVALLGLLPLTAARALTGVPSLAALGLGLGKWRQGLGWLALGIPISVALAWTGAHNPQMRAVYPLDPSLGGVSGALVRHSLMSGLYYLSWEVLFRGVLLFGLRPSIGGSAANAVQAVLSTIAHFGRPFPETLLALPAGLLLGAIDLRVGSIWYLAMVHWVLAVSMDLFILGGAA